MLKWGKQNIRKAKQGDCIMSTKIRDDEVCTVASASIIRSAACQLALTLPKFLSCAWTSDCEQKAVDLSLLPKTASPFRAFYSPFHLVYLCTWIFYKDPEMDLFIYYHYRACYQNFKGQKWHMRMPNKMLAKRMQDEEVCKLQLNGYGQQGIQIRANKIETQEVIGFFTGISFAWLYWKY